MKKTTVVIAGMLASTFALAQANDWLFQWHGQTRGLIFEQTNLMDNVKAAIRDDVAHVMSNVAVSNTETFAISPGHPKYGAADGFMNIAMKGRICPGDFPLNYYRIINGTTCFLLDNAACSVYASAVALTNQYAVQISALPQVIDMFTNGFDVANMTLEQKSMHIWHPELEELKLDNVTQYEADISAALPKGANWITVFYPSVLSYRQEQFEDGGGFLLTCGLIARVNRPAMPVLKTLVFVYKDGRWRWCPEIL